MSMHYWVRFLLAFSTALLFIFFPETVSAQNSGTKGRDRSPAISREVRQKLDHWLIFPLLHYKEFQQTNRSLEQQQALKKQLQSYRGGIALDLRQPEPAIEVIIKARRGSALAHHKKLQVSGVYQAGESEFLTARVRLADLEEIALNSEVEGIEASRILYPLLNESVPDIHGDDVWRGNVDFPIDPMITGKGVYVGIIEGGLPMWSHETFKDEHGNTRFRKLRELDSSGNATEYENSDSFPTGEFGGHATHVAGIAAGRGNQSGDFRGVAYEADLLWGGYNMTDIPDTMSTNGFIAAFDWMIQESGNTPLVVNSSVGTLSPHPHDGSTFVEQVINSLITENKILIQAAGNFGRGTFGRDRIFNYHYDGTVPNDGNSLVIEAELPPENFSNSEFSVEIWYDSAIELDVRVADKNNNWYAWVEFDQTMPILINDNDSVYIYNNGNSSYHGDNGDNVIFLMFLSGDNLLAPGIYKFELKAHNNGPGGEIDAYSSYPPDKNDKGKFESGFVNLHGGNSFQTIALPGYTSKAITVGAYSLIVDGTTTDISGDIAFFSSKGPGRTDHPDIVSKPDITAPGVNIFSAEIQNNSDINSYYYFGSGTSQAAPHVTGAIALLLQNFPELTADEVKNILKASAGEIPDQMGGTKPPGLVDRRYWGAGKLDILAAYQSMAGFTYNMLFLHKDKFTNAFESAKARAGIPVEPVKQVISGIYKQKLTNGGIFYREPDDNAYWMGTGIWDYWVDVLGGLVNSTPLGFPVSSEAPWNHLRKVDFENGFIYWDGSQARRVLYSQTAWLEDFSTFNVDNYHTSGAAYYDDLNSYFVLTPNSNLKRGRLYFTTPFSIEEFTADFDIKIGGGSGADGLVFGFVADYNYPTSNGELLDFKNTNGYGVEFDTYLNNSSNDPSEEHIGILFSSPSNHLFQYVAGSNEIEDNRWHHVRVVWDSGFVAVHFDGELKIKETIPDYNIYPGYFGFSAATHTYNNWHIIDNVVISNRTANFVTLTAPNGGEIWGSGLPHKIAWASNDVSAIVLEYSTDNGIHWLPISENIPANEQPYSWSVPNTPSTTCLIRARDAADSTVFDISNETFTIVSDILSEGLVAYYPFDGNASDESGNENHGQTLGAGLTEDRSGNPNSAYQFDGLDDYISVPNSTSLQSPISATTISTWLLINSWHRGFAPVCAKSSNSSSAQYGLEIRNNGNIIVRAANSSVELSTNYPFQFETWYFLAFSWDGKKVDAYVDGTKIGTRKFSPQPRMNNLPLEIGRHSPGSREYLNGMLDDLRIYNRALSEIEIQALYAGQITNIDHNGSEFAQIPPDFTLSQNYPNPFNPETHISYGLPKTTHVRLEIYNLLGQLLAVLVDERKPPGSYVVNFDARNYASGIYIFRLVSKEFNAAKKMIFLK